MTTIIFAIVVLGLLGALFGAVLGLASKIFHVDQDPRLEQVRECLAGANCGGCGFPGCDGYAAAVVGGAPTNKCVVAGPEAAAKIGEIMGVSADATDKMVAHVTCSGSNDVAQPRFNYSGPKTCQAAMLFGGRDLRSLRRCLPEEDHRDGPVQTEGHSHLLQPGQGRCRNETVRRRLYRLYEVPA